MSTAASPLTYTEIEIRSYLPSGWGIAPGGGRWDPRSGRFSVQVYDGADNTWEIAVDAEKAGKAGRLEALRAAIDRVQRKGLGRKSVMLG